jgi:hypothetical protein
MRSVHTDVFTAAEWDLLVRLPGQIVVAATSAGPGRPRRTVAAGLAGLDAVAAGRTWPNALVRQVVGTIYAEREEDAPVAEEFTDRVAGLDRVLASCRRAHGILAARGTPDEHAAYAAWIVSIAERVGASPSGGRLSVGGTVDSAERQFTAGIAGAFR